MGDAAAGHAGAQSDFTSFPNILMGGIRLLLVALLGLLTPLVSTAQQDEMRVALIIGNSSYRTAPLANPANDAADLAHALERKGFRVLVRENVSERGLKEAVETFAGYLKKGGVGLFFFR